VRRLWILALAACSDPEPERFRLEVPIEDGDRAMIVGVEVGSSAMVNAIAIGEAGTIDQPLDIGFPLEDELAVTALLYRQTLDDLSLEAGAIQAESDPEKQRPLPRADRVERITVRDGAPSEWAESELPRPLDELRITAPDRCGAFVPRAVPIGEGGQPVFVLALDDRWVLVATNTRLLPGESPSVVFLDRDGNAVRQTGLPSSFFDGYREDGGTIWLGGEGGVVYRATFTSNPEPSLAVVATSTVGSREDIISLVGPPSGAPFEQFALTTNRDPNGQWGAFEWFDGQRWIQPGLRRNTPHDATWVAPGYGLFASFYRETLVYGARDGAEIEIQVASIVFGSVVEIEAMPGLGLVAGTSGGEVHLMRDGVWSLIANVNTETINGLARYEDGLVYLSGDNMIRWVDPDTACEENVIDRIDLAFVRSLAVLGTDVIVPLVARGALEDQVGEQFVGWFERAP
jgi:hypothetical protein